MFTPADYLGTIGRSLNFKLNGQIGPGTGTSITLRVYLGLDTVTFSNNVKIMETVFVPLAGSNLFTWEMDSVQRTADQMDSSSAFHQDGVTILENLLSATYVTNILHGLLITAQWDAGAGGFLSGCLIVTGS